VPGAAPTTASSPAASAEALKANLSPQALQKHGAIVDAREAHRRRDSSKLASVRAQTVSQQHPLASWVDYWDLSHRLMVAQPEEVEAFYTRWRGRYVEDRLRNDWLQELGRRRDWTNFTRDFPRFRMNDDLEVTCYHVLTQHLSGKAVKAAAMAAWMEQRDADDGCQLLARTLQEAQIIGQDELWTKVRSAIDMSRLRAARNAAGLISPSAADTLNDVTQNPLRYLNTKANGKSRQGQELTAITLARIATSDPDLAAASLRSKWQGNLPRHLTVWTWGQIGEQAALKHQANALEYYGEAFKVVDKAPAASAALSDETLAWAVRAALRSSDDARWAIAQRAIETMRPTTVAAEPAWPYWLARAQLASAKPGAQGEDARRQAQTALRGLAGDLSFYGALAAEESGQSLTMPNKPDALTTAELEAAKQHPGLQSALTMIAIGLRDEGVREWNYSLRGMDDRQLLAAAQVACNAQVWDRCINTSERTRSVVDLDQRYPLPFRKELIAKARDMGLDPAYVFGLIRQESRFISDAKSHVGAGGLMQIMPATARWTAQKLGLPYKQDNITDPAFNMALGTQYLKLVLDDFGGSQAMAAAAYNAGPSRPRRWREGQTIDAAAWAESIPFNETRDYVKKVLTNAVVYANLMGNKSTLRARLGASIGPREAAAPTPNRELP
jgi:soluble lytic murein transglycosylase